MSQQLQSPSTTISSVIIMCLIHLEPATNGSPLSSYITYFEPVYFNTSDVKLQLHSNHRAKRSLSPQNTINLDFKAQNRLFRLRLLESSANVFSKDVQFESTGGAINFSRSKVFSGYLEDDHLAQVDGILTSDGSFDGHVQTRDQLFYIEPSNRYFSNSEDSRPEFPAVIYSSDDVNHPHLGRHGQPCESHHLHLKTRERWLTDSPYHHHHHHNFSYINNHIDKYESLPESNHFHNGVLTIDEPKHVQSRVTTTTGNNRGKTKQKRASGDYYDKRKTTCMLYLQADHLFYEKMGRSEEACIEVMTRHVQRVNSIYRAVDFDMDGTPDNISFMIKRIKVHTQDALEDPTYRFPGNYGVEKFLEIFSEEDYDAFCLAYMFTYRDFEGGTLGLAWTGDLKNAGGVCEKNGHYRGSYKSLNTGIITLMNYGKHVPPAVSHVTMAHEMGHNFGSPHDPESDANCVPGGEDGNYIMFARATSGDKYNNKRFSNCSLRSINEVLTAKARGPKGCFTEPEIAICGNGVVEEGEECDCGWEEDCLENCCWPQRTKYSSNQIPCTLRRPQALCSPSQGPCCNHDCSYNQGNKCRDDNGCRGESFCDGRGVQCPPSILKPNRTVCNDGDFVCFQGECTGSICLAYGLESCQCTQEEGDSDTKPCELCCKEPGEDSPCVSSFSWQFAPHDVPDMYSKPGTPCNNYQGYCDVFQKCREVDPLGPLLTLRELLFSDNSIMTLKNFITKYWYSVILAAIAVVALMVTIIKLCGKKTPLVHHRRHRRRKTLHHVNNAALEPNQDGPDGVHVHPTAVKTDIVKHKSKYKEDKETRKHKRKEQDRKHSAKRAAVKEPKEAHHENEKYDSAQNLANKLTAKLMSVLPPENGKITADKYVRVENESGSSDSQSNTKGSDGSVERSVRTKSKDNRVRDRKSASPEKHDKLDAKMKREKRQRSKSEIVHRNNGMELIEDKQELANKATSSSNKDKNQQQPKEVTIAKLGPFKMSLEVKNNERVADNKSKERKVRHSRVNDEHKKDTLVEHKKESSTEKSSQNARKKRTRSKSEHRSKDELKHSDTKQSNSTEAAAKRSDIHFDEIKTEAEYLKYENQISIESKKSKKKKDKIVVSKLAKSDRPVREKSPEKVLKVETFKKAVDRSSDTEEKENYNSSSKKFNRSVSQPAPPPEIDKLLLSTESQNGLKRNLSLIIDEKEKPPKLKRSSTAKDSFVQNTNQKHSRSKIVESLTENNSSLPSKTDKMSLYDNLAFDSSPDLGQSSNFDKRQQTLLQLKDQIQSQLLIAGAANASDSTSSKSKNKRRKVNNVDAFFPIKDVPEAKTDVVNDDTDDTDDGNRESPPTQIQSLSEESSGSSTRRKTNHLSGSIKFDSSEEDSDEGEEPLVGLGLVHNSLPRNNSKAQLLDSDSESGDDFSTVPVYASNPHVKIPQGVPVPVPRTSLHNKVLHEASNNHDNHERVTSDNGCDSDSTIDIRIRKPDKHSNKAQIKQRDSNWTVSELDVDEDWEVKEDSSDNDNEDNITDIDATSIITDGIAQQMMY